jgi:hypothetical protein
MYLHILRQLRFSEGSRDAREMDFWSLFFLGWVEGVLKGLFLDWRTDHREFHLTDFLFWNLLRTVGHVGVQTSGGF